MFDIGWMEILVIAMVAVVVVGPKELPRVLVSVGRWVTKGRALAREFQDGVQTVMREAELEELRVDLPDPNSILGENPLSQGKSVVGGSDAIPEEQFIDDEIVAEMEKADEETAAMLRDATAQQVADAEEIEAEETGQATLPLDADDPPVPPTQKPAADV